MITNRIYSSSPYFIKVIAASLRGYVYAKRRYGSDIESKVNEIIERDYWSDNQWQEWQEYKLERLLDLAAKKVPFYQDLWQKRRRIGDRSSWNYLENWPILEKGTLRQTPERFLVEGISKSQLSEEHTSGTSGTPLILWRSKKTDQIWYAQVEARLRKWNGVSLNDRWGILGGQLVTKVDRKTPPFWVWNAGLKQLYFSVYHISEKNIPDYIEAITNYKIQYLLGYPSAISILAKFALEMGLELPELKVILTNAETLLLFQREIIQRAFHCRVVDTYGNSEIVAAGSECSQGEMHQWPDTGVIEILEERSTTPVHEGGIGRMICTGLINEEMPLIRYDIGDLAVLSSTKKCKCGRHLPMLGSIAGRKDDILLMPDGRYVGRMDTVFKSNLPIREAQIIQEKMDQITVKVIPAKDFDSLTVDTIKVLVKKRLGKVEVEVIQVDDIPRGKNGKFRAVLSKLNSGAEE